MALPAGTQTTYTTTGEREDLESLIYNIDPTETPFLMMAGRGSASSVKHEWQMDRLSDADDNAQLEGDDAAGLTVVETVRMANFCQIATKAIVVSGTDEVVDKAGRNSELSYQLAKRSKELKRDIEFTMVGNDTVADMLSAVGAAGAARRSGAMQSFYHANSVVGGTALPGANISRGASPGADGGFNTTTDILGAPTDGVQRALLESTLKGVIQGAWTNGGDPSVIMCGPFNKTVISGFTGNSTRFDRGEDKRLVAAIDVYVSDFGDHRVVPNRFSRERDVFALTPELIEVRYLRPFRQHALSKTGDSEKRQLVVEYTLKNSNNAGHGIVADLTTS